MQKHLPLQSHPSLQPDVKPIIRPLSSLRNRFLDRCVLRPSMHIIDPGEQTRCNLPLHLPGSKQTTNLETFVATNLTGDAALSSKIPKDATELTDWSSVPHPATLLIKFPGTAGRAERSSPFPANLIAARLTNDLPGQPDPSSGRSEKDDTTSGCSPRSANSVEPGQHYEVWTWNPPGYGRSGGRASLAKLVPAAEEFASQVVGARGGSRTQIWLCGNSLGCLPALSLAARLPQWQPPNLDVDNCLLWLRNPPDLANTILGVADRYASRSWMQRLVAHLPETLNARANAAKCNLPAVFLMSEHDELVPPHLQRGIHEAYRGAHRVVMLAELGHSGAIEEQHRGEVQAAVDWLLATTAS
ncbi:alpha/beta hydrolase [Allorhodopirellula heiligendammensis]|uniref:Alpha/beta hydrolase family protein n=1 Tax=Allorhodopirellula heiligendammensis TaxID=2714739 RepID=A0A5C6C5M0_9BACT|nr:alpha/beta hydrolase [Allorhodopirellula heiligendammensis]TWU19883.1 Alpha/beta hydrolase family protein [Allorhodopirellula heiligendammensis]